MENFHAKTGDGYEFIGDSVIELDALNPQVAARLAGKSYNALTHPLVHTHTHTHPHTYTHTYTYTLPE